MSTNIMDIPGIILMLFLSNIVQGGGRENAGHLRATFKQWKLAPSKNIQDTNL